MSVDTSGIVRLARDRLCESADPHKAQPMASYMKTDMPFHGVQKPARAKIAAELRQQYPLSTRRDYECAVRALWRLSHREEKYLALALADAYPEFKTHESIPLYRKLILEGAWWDFVDDIASRCVGWVVLHEREPAASTSLSGSSELWIGGREMLDHWVTDENMWIRRSALLAHLRHKEKTDARQLFTHCLMLAGEREFFIRKAIGWALRQYSITSPRAVGEFLRHHRSELSPLSYREGAKHLVREGLMEVDE
jgi:3-methyladenine DNA glycosylase AlkD